jgi:hypothetical protein
MKSVPLGYGRMPNPRRRVSFQFLTIIAAISGALALARLITVHKTWRMDAVTGSMQTQIVWPLGISLAPTFDPSPLELRLTKMGTQWNRNWSFLHDTQYTITGHGCGCGTAPPIYQLRPAMQQFVDASTDAELRQFVAVMQSGTAAQQTAAIDSAAEKGLQAAAR